MSTEMFLPSRLFLACLLLVASAATLAMPKVDGLDFDTFQITHFVNTKQDLGTVMIGAGSQQGIVDGAIFRSYRQKMTGSAFGAHSIRNIWVETGVLKALAVHANYTIAKVVTTGSPLSTTFFPKFPGVMAGDFVKERRVTVASVRRVMPMTSLEFRKLFIDPKGAPATFELTETGKQALREAAQPYINAHVGTLFVEGFTDHNGDSSANQVESYQRAMTVRQFLIDELQFQPERVVALGFGEEEPVIGDYAPGYRNANRRIVLKTGE